ncbi:uncharacterized protein LOC116165775 [Photinus pyralis]|uniref:uncharacterized protein LOC116165775 n=1 Tax=Photinus pyralis TaxID=7054 RepID=UPI0012673261|nr:uncharacterized protein LOC116165775 [Photinus pyralis]
MPLDNITDVQAPQEEPPRGTQAGPQPQTTTIAATAVVLPAFWPNRVELWFSMAEAKFDLAHPKITREDTRFNHVLTVLPPEIADEVSDLIIQPDPNTPYTKLKSAIVTRMAMTDSQKLKKLLSGEELGSRKPSQLLRHMRQLVQNSSYVNDRALKELFLQQLPTSVQAILVSLYQLTLEQLAETADRVLEITPTVAAVSSPQPQTEQAGASSSPPSYDAIAALTSKMTELLQILTVQNNRSRNNYRGRSRSRSASSSKECWYHRKFGASAKKCIPPCTGKKNEAQQ